MLDSYRKDHFAEAGIKKTPANWAELRAVAKQLTKDGRLGFDPFSIDLRQCWETFLFANGGRLFSEDGKKVLFTEAGGVEALQFFKDLIKDGSADYAKRTDAGAPGARWLHAEGTGGYVFPKPATLRALREERTATWREINLKYGTDTPVTRPYLTLWQDHGAAPAGASYFWLQAPAASAGRTRQWAAAPPVELVSDSTAVHAVRRRADGLLAANFWTANFWTAGASPSQELAADGPASVLVRPEGRTVTVALSDPTQLRSSAVVDLARRGLTVAAADPGVRATATGRGSRITADTANLHGATLNLTLKRN
ncbi:Xanthan lyase precursor [Streptomyces sp. S4.7]|nr:Xanthan lyase precursor [Streptomyces sp. S4.7]